MWKAKTSLCAHRRVIMEEHRHHQDPGKLLPGLTDGWGDCSRVCKGSL